MRDRSFISSIGILIYVLLSIVDRFLYRMPDYIYILVAVIGIFIIIFGFIYDKVEHNLKKKK